MLVYSLDVENVNLLNRKSLARAIGVDEKTIWRWQQRRLFDQGLNGPPSVLIGKRHYYKLDWVVDWLRATSFYSASRVTLPVRDQPLPTDQS